VVQEIGAAMLDFGPSLVLFWVGTVRQKTAGVQGNVGSEITSLFASCACLSELNQPVLDVHVLITFRKLNKK
jgi:hypothetical protein